MKKTVLTFGVISGLISTVMMLATIPFMQTVRAADRSPPKVPLTIADRGNCSRA